MIPRDVWKGGVLLPTIVATAAGTVPWVAAVVATMLIGKGPFLPASIALFSLLAFTLIITTCTMTTTKVTTRSVEIAGVTLLALLLPLDWGLACQRSGVEGWPLALIAIFAMTSAGGREEVSLTCNAVVAIWLVLRSIEDSFPYGLYSPYDKEAADRCGIDEISQIRCSLGWELFVVSLGARIVPLIANTTLCYGASIALKRQQSTMVTIANTELVAWELVKFNIDDAQRIVELVAEESTEEEGLKSSLVALINALRVYKSYLPQSVVLMEQNATLFTSDIQLPDNMFDTYRSSSGRNMNSSDLYLTRDWGPSQQSVKKSSAPDEGGEQARREKSAGSSEEQHHPLRSSIPPGLIIEVEDPVPDKADTASSGSAGPQIPAAPSPVAPSPAAAEQTWLNKPGFFRPKYATLLLIEVDIDLEETAGGPGGIVNVFVKKAIETAKAFEGVTLHIEANRVLVSWNTHKTHHQHAAAACGCALELDTSLREAEFPAWHGIAIASGTFFVGSAGVKEQMAAVVVGQHTQLLSGVISLSKQIQTHILIIDKVFTAVRAMVDARPVDCLKSHDSMETVLIYELLGTKPPQLTGAQPPRSAQLYVEAFSMLRQLRLLECRAKLVEYLAMFRDDEQAQRLYKLSSWLHNSPQRLDELRATGYHRAQLSYWEDYEGSAEAAANDLRLLIPTDSSEQKGDDAESESANSETGFPRIPSHSSSNSLNPSSIHRKWSFRSGRSVRSGSGSIGRRPTTAADTSTGKLRQQLIEAHHREMHKEDGDEPISPGCLASREVPTQFQDTAERMWFRSDRRLGKGAFGDVWLGMGANGGLVAMKVMKLPAMPEDEFPRSPASPLAGSLVGSRGSQSSLPRRRSRRNNASRYGSPKNNVKELLQEVAMLEELRHDNVVGYLGSCVAGRNVLIVMEYLSGGSLADVVQEFSSLPITSIRRYTRDIVQGLTFLHDHDIVHRDLKPHNVLMTNEGECKLADFGTATLLSENITPNNQGGLAGTPLYMSPEAAAGAIDKSADIWALGILVCQLFTGTVPYDLPSKSEFVGQAFLYKLKTENVMPTIPELQPDAEEFVRSCLHRDPTTRATARSLDSSPFLLT